MRQASEGGTFNEALVKQNLIEIARFRPSFRASVFDCTERSPF